MLQSIRVRAVDGAVVFAVDPTTGRTSTPLRAIGREGPSAFSPAMPHEEVIAYPVIIRAIASGDLVIVEDEPEAPTEAPNDASGDASSEPEKENG